MSRRDYSKKSHAYRAPRMHVRRDKVKREIVKKRVKAFFIAAGFISWTASIGYWAFLSPLFIISDLRVEDTLQNQFPAKHAEIEAFVRAYADKRIFFIFPRKNYFLFSPARLIRDLEKTQFNPPVETFTIQTEFPRKVLVTFALRVPRLVVVTREVRQKTQSETAVSEENSAGGEVKGESVEVIEHNYLADGEGVVVGANPKISSPALPRVVLKTGKVFKQYDAILPAPLVTAVFTLMENFEKRMEFEADPEHDDEFTARTENGYSIYFSLQYPLSKQLTYFESVISKIGDRQSQITYIDLRIDNRAYICCNLEL